MTIEQRAEAYIKPFAHNLHLGQEESVKNDFIAGFTEAEQFYKQQTASLEARVKELEEALAESLQHMENHYRFESNEAISYTLKKSIKKANNALNPKQQ